MTLRMANTEQEPRKGSGWGALENTSFPHLGVVPFFSPRPFDFLYESIQLDDETLTSYMTFAKCLMQFPPFSSGFRTLSTVSNCQIKPKGVNFSNELKLSEYILLQYQHSLPTPDLLNETNRQNGRVHFKSVKQNQMVPPLKNSQCVSALGMALGYFSYTLHQALTTVSFFSFAISFIVSLALLSSSSVVVA